MIGSWASTSCFGESALKKATQVWCTCIGGLYSIISVGSFSKAAGSIKRGRGRLRLDIITRGAINNQSGRAVVSS